MATFTLPNLPRPILPWRFLPTFFQRVAIIYKRKIILRLSMGPNFDSEYHSQTFESGKNEVKTMSFKKVTCGYPVRCLSIFALWNLSRTKH